MAIGVSASRIAMAVIAAAWSAGCGDDGDGQCVTTLCDPQSHGAVCVGHRVQTCAADGKRFTYRECGTQERCDQSSGSCVQRACTNLGRASCASVTEIERCADDGSGFSRISCGQGEICRDGACVPSSCTNEADRCSDNGVLACEQGSWVQSNCPVGQVCAVGDNGLARCQAPLCVPEARRCGSDEVALICDARGTVEAVVACAARESCVDGVCQATVCGGGGDTVDVSEVDDTAGETEVSEPESRIVFTLNGRVETFDISAFAAFDAGAREVRVRASKATRSLELRLSPANMTVQGTFSSEVFNPVKVLICYDDGGAAAGFADCEDATHRSTAYEVVVTRNDGTGGRIEATFSATLEDVNTDTLALTAGQINVRYR